MWVHCHSNSNTTYTITTTIQCYETVSQYPSNSFSLADLQLVSLVLILVAAAMTLSAHMFFICGYIPCAKCKTCGMGALPAVLITSGKR